MLHWDYQCTDSARQICRRSGDGLLESRSRTCRGGTNEAWGLVGPAEGSAERSGEESPARSGDATEGSAEGPEGTAEPNDGAALESATEGVAHA
jgi:hypothetical protein